MKGIIDYGLEHFETSYLQRMVGIWESELANARAIVKENPQLIEKARKEITDRNGRPSRD